MQRSSVVKGMSCLLFAAGMVMVGLVGVAGAEQTAPAAPRGALDGKVFVGEIGAKGKAKGDKDGFRFQAGTFRSTACDAYGFKEAAYTTVAQTDATTFEAKTVSPTDGKMNWKGTVHGDAIEGTALWNKKPSQAPQEYWSKGRLKQ